MSTQHVIVPALAISFLSRIRGQCVAAAYVDHLRASCVDRARRAGNVEEIDWLSGVRHVEDRGSARFDQTIQPVDTCGGMVSHVGDVAVALADDKGLIGGTAV